MAGLGLQLGFICLFFFFFPSFSRSLVLVAGFKQLRRWLGVWNTQIHKNSLSQWIHLLMMLAQWDRRPWRWEKNIRLVKTSMTCVLPLRNKCYWYRFEQGRRLSTELASPKQKTAISWFCCLFFMKLFAVEKFTKMLARSNLPITQMTTDLPKSASGRSQFLRAFT